MSPSQPSTADAELVAAACNARRHAYAPYSKFLVGAALRLQDGEIVAGANVENASYGLTVCAERVAISTAVAAGNRDFLALAVATAGGHSMCGACRQFAAEFGDLRILLIDADQPQRIVEHRLRELLPFGYRFSK